MEKGIPGDPRFPDRDNKWIDDRQKEKELLCQWLEGFRSEFSEVLAAKVTLESCNSALKLYENVINAVKVPLMIKNARNARREDGSCLEYGLEYHLRQLNGAVSNILKI